MYLNLLIRFPSYIFSKLSQTHIPPHSKIQLGFKQITIETFFTLFEFTNQNEINLQKLTVINVDN